MKDFDFSGLSTAELRGIKEKISKEIQFRTNSEKTAKMNEIMKCIKDYVESYGELIIGFDSDGSIAINKETCCEFILYEDTICLK